MAYQDNATRPQREMVDVSSLGITCAECGTAIEKLPFEPTKKEDDTYGKLYCYECNKKRIQNRPRRPFGNGGGFGGGRRDRF